MIIYYYKQLFIFMNVEKEIEEIKKNGKHILY